MTDRIQNPTRRALLRGAGVGAAAIATGLTVPGLAPRAEAYPAPPVDGFVVPISRDEVIARAMTWVDNPRRYSMQDSSTGPDGEGIRWRTDCSGFVSMALKCRFTDNPPGQTTETLHPDLGYGITEQIDTLDMRPGDLILQRGRDSASGIGHVVLFNGWLDGYGTYECIEQAASTNGTFKHPRKALYDGTTGYACFRYKLLTD